MSRKEQSDWTAINAAVAVSIQLRMNTAASNKLMFRLPRKSFIAWSIAASRTDKIDAKNIVKEH